MSNGPLSGIKVVEFLGLGPGPFGCQLLADLGADVLTVARPGQTPRSMLRNRAVLELDVKDAAASRALREVIDGCDVLVEGFRPGVLERLGFGPTALRETNPGLIVARMTGWGQTGPYAQLAGHDLNFIAVTGALHHGSRAGSAPVPPANLLGDFGGGGMYLVTAVLAALVERGRTGTGQVLDVAIVDGVTYLTSMLHEYRTLGKWSDEAGTNRLDTGAPYYDVYPTLDGRFVAVGALEDTFFTALAEVLGLGPEDCLDRQDPRRWPALRRRITDIVATRTLADWVLLAAGTDACLTPVLTLAEAAGDPHVAARGILVGDDAAGWTPRLPLAFEPVGAEVTDLLERWGVADPVTARLTGQTVSAPTATGPAVRAEP